MNNVQQLILNQIVNSRPVNGWYKLLCKVCFDHGRKGKRAGFKFEDETVVYNCFNCSLGASYDGSNILTKKFIKVLKAFNISDEEIDRLKFSFIGSSADQKEKKLKIKNYEPLRIDLPKDFYPLDDSNDNVFNQLAIEYLETRNIDYKTFKCYWSDGTESGRVELSFQFIRMIT